MLPDRRPRGHAVLPRLGAGLGVGALLVLAFVCLAGDLQAGDSKAKKKAQAAKSKDLAFQATYGQALLEARIRNLPVFVSRHKDF